MNISDLQNYFRSLSDSERTELEDEGLRVDELLAPSGYDASPFGYVTFASTGGDGVHFNVPLGDVGPIVMTVPMAFDGPNIIVGANIEEFLALGCVYGYFGLEQLAYNMEGAIRAIQTAEDQSAALSKLSHQFGLEPWPAVGKRLDQLNRPNHSIQRTPDGAADR